MKKSFALILCLVFVISIALVTCVAFVPMNVTQVADAATTSLTTDVLYYIDDVGFSHLTYYGDYGVSTTNDTRCGLPFRKYSNYPSSYTQYTYMRCSCNVSNHQYTGVIITWYVSNPSSNTGYLCYAGGTSASANGFPTDGWYYGTYQNGYTTKTPLESSYFTGDGLHCFEFRNAVTTAIITSSNCFNVVKDMFTPMPVEPASPELGSIDLTNFGTTIRYDGQSEVASFTQLYRVELNNALNYEVTGSVRNYVDMDISYTFSDGDISSSSITVLAERVGSFHRYYLSLALPHDMDNYVSYAGESIPFYTNDVVSVSLAYAGSSNTIIISADSNSDVFAVFNLNFENLMRSGINYNSFWSGYTYGVNTNDRAGNTLIHTLWSVFEFPFKILFGEYDTDVNSPTYQRYVGGLFNFTILGLDIRAFVLSLVSLCIVIGCIKLIIGLRGKM